MKKILVLILSGLLLNACSGTQNFKNVSVGNAFGTTYQIIYITPVAFNLQQQIDSVFNAVNKSMSTYIPSSDITKINNGDSTVVVDHMFKDVFNLSKKVYRSTNGYFDPTVGVLVNAWGFGPEKGMALDSSKVDSLKQFVGFNKVALQKNGTIKKDHKNLRFDFNAIAKGYAIDRLGVMLKNNNCDNFLVEVGGEVVAAGSNTKDKRPWRVGIDNPTVSKRGAAGTITLTNKALASSGNYRKYRIDSITGEKYVHTINPKTGYTKNSNVLGATVVANTCAVADAYATAFMAMDLEDSKTLLKKQPGLEAFIIYLDTQGNTKAFKTSFFKNLNP